MPTYEIQKNGRTLEIDAPAPPSAADVARAFAAMQAPAQKVSNSPPATFMNVMDAGPNMPVLRAAIGTAKSAANSVFGLGKIVHDYTPIGRISDAILPDAFEQRPPELQPNGLMERIGYAGEQMAEFMLPMSTAGKAAQAARSALTTKAQTGSTGAALASGAMAAAVPAVMSAASGGASMLRSSAEKTIAQSLGATKEAMKAEAARIAPTMLEKGVSGTRAGMLSQAKAQVKAIGTLIDAEVAKQAAAGAVVDGLQVRGAVQLAADALKVRNAAGTMIPVRGAETAVAELDKLDKFVEALGTDIPFDKAQAVKQTWQHIVSKAGLYGPKATSTATDNASASALREGAGVFRELLAKGSPTLDGLNQEYVFWKGLKTVLKATNERTQAQGMGITASIGGSGAGAMVGSMAGGAVTSGIGAVLGPAVVKAMQSAWWKTTAVAPLKNALATALASGNDASVRTVAAQIAAAMPAALRTATAQ